MQLTLLDHLRLTFGHVVYRHRAHSQIAHAHARWSRWLRVIEASLLILVVFSACGVAFTKGAAYAVLCVVFALVAIAALLIDLVFNLESSARAHAACAAQLWLIRERYRSLLSDLADGATDLEGARHRRDALMSELHAVYENAPAADRPAYQAAARSASVVDEPALSDEEIDLFLPKSLQKPA